MLQTRRGAVLAGAARLVGADLNAIVSAFTELMEDSALYQRMAQHRDLFGDGMAGLRIAAVLKSGYSAQAPAVQPSMSAA